jgi:hypothetical protein
MSRMTVTTGPVTGGVDTHSLSHHAAVIDQVGRASGEREFPAIPAGRGDPALRVARRSAVKTRTQATNQLTALPLTRPADLREKLRHLNTQGLIDTCARPTRSRPPNSRYGVRGRRHQHLTEKIFAAYAELRLWSSPPRRGCSPSEASASRSPGNYCPLLGTTRTGYIPKPPSLTCAASPRSRPAAQKDPPPPDQPWRRPSRQHPPCTVVLTPGCAATHAPAATCNEGPKKD